MLGSGGYKNGCFVDILVFLNGISEFVFPEKQLKTVGLILYSRMYTKFVSSEMLSDVTV